MNSKKSGSIESRDTTNILQCYSVKSSTDANITYKVQYIEDVDAYTCSCPSYYYQNKSYISRSCKHIKAIQNSRIK